jgi:N-acyl-D-amino-acid deacylase
VEDDGPDGANFGLAGRGTVAEGAHADLVVFDAETIIDTATYDDPRRPAAGIEAVVVNGAPVWRAGGATGAPAAGARAAGAGGLMRRRVPPGAHRSGFTGSTYGKRAAPSRWWAGAPSRG